MKTPVTGRKIREKLTYSWWKYALVIVLGAFAVNLHYTVSTYRPPADKKIDLYMLGTIDDDGMRDYVNRVHETRMPDMEEMSVLLLTKDSDYGNMQLTTFVGAGEGDVYLLPRDEFVTLAASGAWEPLEDVPEITSLFTERDLNIQSGWRTDNGTGETHLYGIPVSRLPGLKKYVLTDNAYLSILVTGGNRENCLRFLRILCEDMMEE